MVLTGKKKEKITKEINAWLSTRFKSIRINDEILFKKTDGFIFKLTAFTGGNPLVLEYAENEQAAKKYWFEDGGVFYLEDYDDINELKREIIKDINI